MPNSKQGCKSLCLSHTKPVAKLYLCRYLVNYPALAAATATPTAGKVCQFVICVVCVSQTVTNRVEDWR